MRPSQTGDPSPFRDALEAHLSRNTPLWLLALCASAFLLAYLSPVDASFSDPWGTLLTSQAIIEHGTIQLDPYTRDERYAYAPIERAANGHAYNYFPLGSSVLALPAVWLARLRGEDMVYREDNRQLQNALSAWTIVACTLLIFGLSRCFLNVAWSFGVTVTFVFGTSVASSLGTAYWSSNPALVLGLVCVLLLAGKDPQKTASHRIEIGLAIIAFGAYLCRPTMAVVTLLVAGYLYLRRGRAPVAFCITFGACAGLFILFNWQEYGLLLPPYYQPSRLGSSRFWHALYGHLLSPSRGLLVGSPFFFLTLAGLGIWWRALIRQPLVSFCAAWLVLHWLAISAFHHWWGGWSFGNRLFTDALPAAFLLTILVIRTACKELSQRSRLAATLAFWAASLFAIFVHTHQGLYNPYTLLWNDGVDRNEARVFDWHFPQFLANPAMLGLHERDHELLAMAPFHVGRAILPTTDHAIFEGWSPPEGNGAWRWSSSTSPSVLIKLEAPLPRDGLRLMIEAGTYGQQVIPVRLGATEVGTIRSQRHWEPALYQIDLPPEVLLEARRPLPGGRLLQIDFDVPGAALVGDGPEERRLGICLRRITLAPLTGS
ncbi:MAG: hypothetical protein AAF657_03690 [Acidobacteriota bacterium]